MELKIPARSRRFELDQDRYSKVEFVDYIQQNSGMLISRDPKRVLNLSKNPKENPRFKI